MVYIIDIYIHKALLVASFPIAIHFLTKPKMNRALFKIWHFLILLQHIQKSLAMTYEFIMEDERIFSDCKDKPPGTLDVNDLFDFTNTTFQMSESGVTLSGCKTVIWDIQPTDRVEVTKNKITEIYRSYKPYFQLAVSVLYFDRGTWQPTTLNMLIKDFCKVMFDEKQVWYDSYSKHIQNAAEVNNTCYRVKGVSNIP